MVTQSPSLHPASLNMGTAANPSGQCAAEAVRLAAAALIYMHGTGDAGNAVDPSQRCLSPDIFQEDVTQASEACYDGDPTLSAVQELHDGPWDSLIPPDTSFGLTDFIPDGVCGDVASLGECDDTVSQGACWEQGVDFAGLTPLDVCLAKHTLDLEQHRASVQTSAEKPGLGVRRQPGKNRV
ncbi:hypothetical protein HYQ46_011898 [Verticillium longisporum]|nr:hypothetical protein HYQ46_011898 [Verticillium longisporum]